MRNRLGEDRLGRKIKERILGKGSEEKEMKNRREVRREEYSI
jgi:hypothetical protein